MIRLNCFFKAHEGKYDEAIENAIALVAESQRQEGCIAYDVFESGTRGDVFLICETWADQATLDAHSASEPFAQYVGALKELCDIKIETFNF